MPVVAIRTPEDGILGTVAPLGLAASVGTALMIDLDPSGPAYPSETSLRQLVEESPRKADLVPGQRGLAVVRNGGIAWPAARRTVAALATGWPQVVLRLPPDGRTELEVRTIVVRSVLPGWMANLQADVWQLTGLTHPGRRTGIRLPRPSPSTIAALATGRLPVRSRWVRAWSRVWAD